KPRASRPTWSWKKSSRRRRRRSKAKAPRRRQHRLAPADDKTSLAQPITRLGYEDARVHSSNKAHVKTIWSSRRPCFTIADQKTNPHRRARRRRSNALLPSTRADIIAGSGTVIGLPAKPCAHSNDPCTVLAGKPRTVFVCAVVSNGTPAFTVNGAA